MKLDQYYTPNELIQMLDLPIHEDDLLFEPCVGTGQIPDNIPSEVWYQKDIVTHPEWDATDEKLFGDFNRCVGGIDWTITNPPFNQALPILKNAIKYSKKGVAFLLRLTFLEPTIDRYQFFKDNPPTSMVICPRPVFLKPKTGNAELDAKFRHNDEYNKFFDNTSCMWLIWDKSKEPMDISWFPRPKQYTWDNE